MTEFFRRFKDAITRGKRMPWQVVRQEMEKQQHEELQAIIDEVAALEVAHEG